jgi:cyclopropane fatty-acyl-phospholipid synthase-like methyltransferase
MNRRLFRLVYRLMYRLSHPNWDTGTTPKQLVEAFAQNHLLPGPVLDLGCGTGTHVIYMAQQGRTAIGIDFVPEAIARARQKAEAARVSDRTQFLVADVTQLGKLGLPLCSFAMDMGCFHGLNRQDQRLYLEGLSAQMLPGGCFLLYVADPRREAGIAFGMSLEAVQEAVSPWFQITHSERDSFWGGDATWIWMKRPEKNQA